MPSAVSSLGWSICFWFSETSREGGTSAGPKKDVWDDHQVTEERGFQAKKEPEQRQVIL